MRTSSATSAKPFAGNSAQADTTAKLLPLVQELMELFRETIGRPDLPSNILKGALRTVRKLLEYRSTLVHLLKLSAMATDTEVEAGRCVFKPGLFLKTLFEC